MKIDISCHPYKPTNKQGIKEICLCDKKNRRWKSQLTVGLRIDKRRAAEKLEARNKSR